MPATRSCAAARYGLRRTTKNSRRHRRANTPCWQGIDCECLDSRQVLDAEPALRHGLAGGMVVPDDAVVYAPRSEEHTSELQSLMRRSYAVFCLKKKTQKIT